MRIPFSLALALAALSGFIALVYEILWARVYGFTAASRAVAFGTMLGSYLLGLAIGSLLSRHWQAEKPDRESALRNLSRLIILSNIVAFAVVPVMSWGVVRYHWAQTLPLVTLGATLLGTLLPLLCHSAITPDRQSGVRMSYVYLANIIGSGLGSLLAGFFFLEWLTLWQLTMALLLLAVLISIALHVGGGLQATRGDFVMWGLAAALAVSSPLLHDGLYERLQHRAYYFKEPRFVQIVESRHGVITVDREKKIYGGGIYDGIIEVRPTLGGGLLRPYFFSAIHAKPAEILVIGMSGGAWTQVLASHPQAEHVTVVEINGGYLEIIKAYPEVASILTNPKINIVIDDGRRWLRRNPERKFDLIVMNTSFHWREFTSALLGREFLELARAHLNPAGLVMWNLTGSARAANTAMTVFPHTMMVSNNCVGSNSPLVVDTDRWRSVLSRYQIDGRPMFDLHTATGRKQLEDMLAVAGPDDNTGALMTRHGMDALYGSARIITDDNLGEEYNFIFSNHPSLERFFFWR